MTAPLKVLGDRVRELRKLRKWSQAQLGAEAGGLNKETVNRLELGGSSTTGTLVAVARALNVEPGQLFIEGDLIRQTGTGDSLPGGDVTNDTAAADSSRVLEPDEGPMLETIRSVRAAIGESMAKLVDVETRLAATRQAAGGAARRTRVRSHR